MIDVDRRSSGPDEIAIVVRVERKVRRELVRVRGESRAQCVFSENV